MESPTDDDAVRGSAPVGPDRGHKRPWCRPLLGSTGSAATDGRPDVPLTDAGEATAKALAQRSTRRRLIAMVSGPLRRHTTAEPAGRVGVGPGPDLEGWDFGERAVQDGVSSWLTVTTILPTWPLASM
ncbi:histidine phosphatase family protein [Streptomyces sp. NPDC051320]|uniref:histidine phosphatase family protein n=1 Tax=Streptomyces sp. NPDC051320 TaxID=3154644 RepID=UPI00343125A1